ncbi:MAG: cyclase family protein [Chloroflexota bacterium]
MTSSSNELLAQLVQALASGSLRVVDLTLPLGADTAILSLPEMWPNTPRFKLHEISRYDERGPFWYCNWFETGEHTGTHFDAPIHWVTGKDLPDSTVDLIPPSQFVAPACVIDVTDDVQQNPDFLLTPTRVEEWESEYGRIPAGSWVFLRTGWSKRTDERAYLNADESGSHTPGWTCECSQFLAEDRDVIGVGVETVGTDAGQAATFDTPFCNHATMHGHGKFGIAGLCNLDQLPAVGAVIVAAPLKIVGGSGSPVRVLALTPESS